MLLTASGGALVLSGVYDRRPGVPDLRRELVSTFSMLRLIKLGGGLFAGLLSIFI